VFLTELERQIEPAWKPPAEHAQWLEWCRTRVSRYPVVQPDQRAAQSPINPYRFMELLFEGLRGGRRGGVWRRSGVHHAVPDRQA